MLELALISWLFSRAAAVDFTDVMCFRCRRCNGDVKSMWYRGSHQRQYRDLNEDYNFLVQDEDMRLVPVECTTNFDEPFVIVQNQYNYAEFEEWLQNLPKSLDSYLRAVVFDQPNEIGFSRGISEHARGWIDRFVEERPQTVPIFTGMETSKADVSEGKTLLRYYNHYLTHAIFNQVDRHATVPQEISDKRFVVLIKKSKQWRFWFLARLFDAGVWDSVDYTCPIAATICSYFHIKLGYVCNEDEGSGDIFLENTQKLTQKLRKAHEYVKSVKPRTFDGTAHVGNIFANEMLEPRGRIHIILESQPASVDFPITRPGEQIVPGWACSWAERLTEKTFNAIAYGHPFMIVGTNNALDLVKAHGFETFSPCINETYAKVADPKLKMLAVAQEAKRIHDLHPQEYHNLYTTCLKPIADSNRNKLLGDIRAKQAQQRLYAFGMLDAPAYDLKNTFHPVCDTEAARTYNFNLTQCRE